MARLAVPDSDTSVTGSRSDIVAVGMEGHAVNIGVMANEDPHALRALGGP